MCRSSTISYLVETTGICRQSPPFFIHKVSFSHLKKAAACLTLTASLTSFGSYPVYRYFSRTKSNVTSLRLCSAMEAKQEVQYQYSSGTVDMRMHRRWKAHPQRSQRIASSSTLRLVHTTQVFASSFRSALAFHSS